jgi:hypothetical protein
MSLIGGSSFQSDLSFTMHRQPIAAAVALAIALLASWTTRPAAQQGPLRFSVTIPAGQAAPLDGRLLVMIAKDPAAGEPRFQINDGPTSQLIFGIDVDGLKPGAAAMLDGSALGFPLESINDIPAGTYSVQALLHKYETFKRSDGHTVKLPMDRGEGQQWARAPGNLYSTPKTITVDPRRSGTIAVALDQVIAPIAPPKDTKYIRHDRIQSALLTKFWGRPMHLGANVLLPEGFDTHPDARYPLFIYHGHFPHTFAGFREEPPDPTLKPDFAARFQLGGYNRIQQQYAYDFSPNSFSNRRRVRITPARWTTVIAPSTAGTATRRAPTRCHACAITRCTSPRQWSAS